MKENVVTATSGWIILFLLIPALAAIVYGLRMIGFVPPGLFIPVIILAIFVMKGFMVIYPNQSNVMTFLGKYVGTVKQLSLIHI